MNRSSTTLGEELANTAACLDAFGDWRHFLAWNLTIAALMCQAAKAEKARADDELRRQLVRGFEMYEWPVGVDDLFPKKET